MTAIGKPEPRLPFALRSATSLDFAMIASSWMKNYQTSRAAQAVDPAIYSEHQGRLVDRLVREFTPLLAVNEAKPEEIHGWICGAGGWLRDGGSPWPVIHYLYVKRSYRKFGIGRTLADALTGGRPAFFTHLPPVREKDPEYFPNAAALVAKLAPGSQFNPYKLWSR